MHNVKFFEKHNVVNFRMAKVALLRQKRAETLISLNCLIDTVHVNATVLISCRDHLRQSSPPPLMQYVFFIIGSVL